MGMNIWTREELLEAIAICKAEKLKALSRASYSIQQRALVSQKIEVLDKALADYRRELAALETGHSGPRIVRAVVRR